MQWARAQGNTDAEFPLPLADRIGNCAKYGKTIPGEITGVVVDQRARLDFALTIGSNAESITVQGSAALLNTSDASVSTLIGNRFPRALLSM